MLFIKHIWFCWWYLKLLQYHCDSLILSRKVKTHSLLTLWITSCGEIASIGSILIKSIRCNYVSNLIISTHIEIWSIELFLLLNVFNYMSHLLLDGKTPICDVLQIRTMNLSRLVFYTIAYVWLVSYERKESIPIATTHKRVVQRAVQWQRFSIKPLLCVATTWCV